jgi:hypothetical protein
MNSTARVNYRAKLFQAWVLLTDAQAECNTTSNKFDIADVGRTVRVFRQKFTLEDAIGSHACSLEALAGV